MVLQELGGGGYDDVQNTEPSSPSIGDTWLDTSTDPPTGKIYADLGSGGQWSTDLLDTNISSRATQSDILSDGTPFDGAHIDSPISESGVDWSTKNYDTSAPTTTHYTNTHLDITGSGYFITIFRGAGDINEWAIEIDGAGPYHIIARGSVNPFVRFNNSLVLSSDGAQESFNNAWVVLD